MKNPVVKRFQLRFIGIAVISLFIIKERSFANTAEHRGIRPLTSDFSYHLDEDLLKDIAGQILNFLKTGDAKSLTKYFNDNVVLSILGENGSYTRFQSEAMLNNFFRKNEPKIVKQTQRISNTNRYTYITYLFESEKKSFRIFLKINLVGGKYLVEELRIDKL